MTEDPKHDDANAEYIIEEEVITYTRKRKLFKYVCSLPNCPYCRNEPLTARHPSKKWCCDEARAEFRRRERAQTAIENDRPPGVIGRPPLPFPTKDLGVFYLHLLDQPKRLDATNVYQLGSAPTWQEYEARFLADPDIKHTFDAVLIKLTLHPQILAENIAAKNNDKRVAPEGDIFYLTDPDVRIAHQMVIEHIQAHELLSVNKGE